jgi:hypothetical protein
MGWAHSAAVVVRMVRATVAERREWVLTVMNELLFKWMEKPLDRPLSLATSVFACCYRVGQLLTSDVFAYFLPGSCVGILLPFWDWWATPAI